MTARAYDHRLAESCLTEALADTAVVLLTGRANPVTPRQFSSPCRLSPNSRPRTISFALRKPLGFRYVGTSCRFFTRRSAMQIRSTPYVMVLLLAQPFLPYLREVIYENP